MKTIQSILLACLFVFASEQLPAQLIIAKDPRACLTGLKDSSGKWVVEPKYTSVEYYLWYYKVHAGSKEGILTWTGKELIPAVYDAVSIAWCQFPGMNDGYLSTEQRQLQSSYFRYFVVTNNGYSGLADASGHEVMAPRLKQLSGFFEGIAIGVTSDNRSAFIDTSGILGYVPDGYTITTDAGSFATSNRFIISRTETDRNGSSVKRYGICNERGTLMLPANYTWIRSGLARLNVILADSTNGYTGVFDKNGHQLAPCKYRVKTPPRVAKMWWDDFVYLLLGSKTGVIDKNGSFIAPCAFDSIRLVRKNYGNQVFLCQHADEYSLFDDNGKLLMKGNYDQVLTPFLGFGSSYFINDILLVVSKGGKWGALNEEGALLMPIQYDTTYITQYFVLFYSANDVRALYPQTGSRYIMVDQCNERGLKPEFGAIDDDNFRNGDTVGQPHMIVQLVNPESLAEFDTIAYCRYLGPGGGYVEIEVNHVWTDDSTHLIWELPVTISYIPSCKMNTYNFDGVSCYAVNKTPEGNVLNEAWKQITLDSALIFCTDRNSTHTYYPNGKTVFKPIKGVYFHFYESRLDDSTGFIKVVSATGKHGMLNMKGEWILDTLWYGAAEFNGDTTWVATSKDGYNDPRGWNLYSRSQNKLLLDPKNELLSVPEYYEGNECVAATSTGVGLLDMHTLKFSIAPTQRYVFHLDDSSRYYAVTGFDGTSHLVNHEGKVLKPAPILHLTLIDKSAYADGHDSLLLFAVYTRNGTSLISNSGMSSYASVSRDSLFDHLPVTKERYVYTGRVSSIPQIVLDSTTQLVTWQRELICDSVVLGHFNCEYRADWNSSGNLSHNERSQNFQYAASWQQTEDQISFSCQFSDPVYTVVWNNPTVLSFVTTAEKRSYNNPSYRGYETYFFIDSVPVKQGLHDLFIGNEWKPIVINALLARLDSQPQIRANCTDNNRYPEMLEYRFLITADSLLLFPEWGMERYLQNPEVCVSIPWNELSPFIKPAVKTVIGIR